MTLIEQPVSRADAVEHVDVRIVDTDVGDNLAFPTDYPHGSYDSPTWAVKRFSKDHRDRIMWGNATALYGLTVTALPGEGGAHGHVDG